MFDFINKQHPEVREGDKLVLVDMGTVLVQILDGVGELLLWTLLMMTWHGGCSDTAASW
jgi:hypothetical protein